MSGEPAAILYRDLLRAAGALDVVVLDRAVDRFDAAAGMLPPGPGVALLRARGAALLANVFPLSGISGARWSALALELATPLREVAELPAGSADGVLAEAYLARCAAASSTAMRTLWAHQCRGAARRALESDPSDLSANFAAGSLALHTPAVFGGSATRAVRHFERVLDSEPCHGGAQLLLARAHSQRRDAAARGAVLATLAACSPRLAELARADVPEAIGRGAKGGRRG